MTSEVQQLFERVAEEQGRLDILVNNATAVPRELAKPGPFWEKSLDLLSDSRRGPALSLRRELLRRTT